MNRKSSILFHFGRLYAVQNAGFSRLLGLAFSTFSQFRATRLTDGDIWHSEWLNKSLCWVDDVHLRSSCTGLVVFI